MNRSTNFIDDLRIELTRLVEEAKDLQSLEQVRVEALGKKGRITSQLKQLGSLAPDLRKENGQALNALKEEISDIISVRVADLKKKEMDRRLKREKIDITLSPRPEARGCIHPITRTIEEIVEIFSGMGFDIVQGPDIEDDWHNFESLNFPPDHPAREMQDTFFLPEEPRNEKPAETDKRQADAFESRHVLRTHTSPVQIRTMLSTPPPLRILVPGRVYRSDYDMTHTPMFHQVEGLLIDKSTHMGHLKGCLIEFCKAFFQTDTLKSRFRPSFFPFTEPSAEMDIGYRKVSGKLEIGEGDEWLEVLGCGMVHPRVLRNCGLDPDVYQGFAFGMGLERVAMLKYGIPDLRTFFESDVRWLDYYGHSPFTTSALTGALVQRDKSSKSSAVPSSSSSAREQ